MSDRRKPSGIKDYLALALSTFGVGYIPGAPGTYGSIVGVALYFISQWLLDLSFVGLGLEVHLVDVSPLSALELRFPTMVAWDHAIVAITILGFTLIGIWASTRSIPIFGTDDPHQAVVDEVIGQIITFLFIPFTTNWKFIVAGFLLFRLFDIWKPYPIDSLQNLPGGLGVCADDIAAGVYAGICLAIIYAVTLM
jgi:phosphatidylglycerophosphatase A